MQYQVTFRSFLPRFASQLFAAGRYFKGVIAMMAALWTLTLLLLFGPEIRDKLVENYEAHLPQIPRVAALVPCLGAFVIASYRTVKAAAQEAFEAGMNSDTEQLIERLRAITVRSGSTRFDAADVFRGLQVTFGAGMVTGRNGPNVVSSYLHDRWGIQPVGAVVMAGTPIDMQTCCTTLLSRLVALHLLELQELRNSFSGDRYLAYMVTETGSKCLLRLEREEKESPDG